MKNLEIEILAHQEGELINGQPTISGTVILKPQESVTVDSMNVYLYTEVKGKMSPIVTLLEVKNLFDYSKQLSRGQKYEFPYTLVVSDGSYSYAGKNAAIHHKLEVGLDINPEDYNKIKPGVFASLKKLVTQDTSIKEKRYIFFENTTKDYKVETEEFTLQRKFIYWLVLVFALFYAAIGVFFISGIEDLHFIVIILGSLLLGFFTQLIYLYFSLTKIPVQLVNNEGETFTLKIKSNSGKLNDEVQYFYEIYETVIDGSGTSSTTYKSKLFKSAVKTPGSSIKAEDLYFEFPPIKTMPSIDMNNFSITWVMCAKKKDTFGLDAVYGSEFEVWLE